MDGLIEIFLFCGVLYYFFNFRVNNMVDVLSTRLQEVYTKWEARTEVPRNAEPSTARYSIEELRRVGNQFHRRKIQDREQARKIRDSSLFKIKESEPLAPPVKQISAFLHYCCSNCTPSSRDTLVNNISKQFMPFGSNILVVNSGRTLFSKAFHCISHVYGFKRYTYPNITQLVLNDEALKDAIEVTASESVENEGCTRQQALAKAKAKAKRILEQMESRISNTLLKITAWLLYKLLPYFLEAAVVLPSQIEMLKRANETGLPLVFLPLHRSHLDYILISFLALTNDIKSPLIAAGDNLKMPIFGWYLKYLGAFFIKRRMDPITGQKDVLYRTILHTYIMESLRAGHNIEFFMEGGRTRTGKPCIPKVGILSVIVDAYMDGIIEDALLVPISMNYERLVDGNFVREQLGQPKKLETFGSTIKAIWSTLIGNYGILKVDFCQPFSLREMIKSFQAQHNKLAVPKPVPAEKPLKYSMSSLSLHGTDVVVEEHRQLLNDIARHVIYDCSKSTPIMSTNVVAFLLLTKFRDGCTLDNLVEAFDDIKQDLEYKNKNVAFCGETVDIINHALDILGPGLVKQQRQEITGRVDDQTLKSKVIIVIYPITILPNVIELAYYSNTVLVHYVLDSVVVTALYAELQSQINDPVAIAQNNITVCQDALVERSLKLCDIFKYEFIFCKPCQELQQIVIETIENLTYTDIITKQEESYLEEELWSRRYAKTFDDSSDDEYSNRLKSRKIEYKVSLAPEHAKRMEFLHTLLRPLVDTYTFSAFTLRKLVGRSLSERDLLHEALSEIKVNLERGIINYGESLCVEPIRNAFKLFEKWNVLECHPQENVKILYLKDEYDVDEAVTKIYETIRSYKWTRNFDKEI